jgi:TonB family protein
VKPLPRGLVAALAASLAVHLGAVTLHWQGARAGAPPPARASTLVARLIEVPGGEAQPSSPVAPSPALAEATPAPLAAPEPATVPDPLIARPAAALPGAASAPLAAALPEPARPSEPARLSEPARQAEPLPTVRGTGEVQASGLDRGPQPLDEIEPVFPAAAGPRGGTVTLRLVITEKGSVESITVVRASTPGLFDEAALTAFGKARFAPALRGGLPVRSEVIYDVDFAPLGKGTESSGRTY